MTFVPADFHLPRNVGLDRFRLEVLTIPMLITSLVTVAAAALLALYAQSFWALVFAVPMLIIALTLHAAASGPPVKATPLMVWKLIANTVVCVTFIFLGVQSHRFLQTQPSRAEHWIDVFYSPIGAAVFIAVSAVLGAVVAWNARRLGVGRKQASPE